MSVYERLAEIKAIATYGYVDRKVPNRVCRECNHVTLYRRSDGRAISINPDSQMHPCCNRCQFCHLRATTNGTTLHYVLPEGVHYACGMWPESSNHLINHLFYAINHQGKVVFVFS